MNKTFTLTIFLLIACCSYFSVNGQQVPDINKQDKKRYVIVQTGADLLPFYNNSNSGIMNVSFPYSISSGAGITDSVFFATKQLFSRSFLTYIYPLYCEIGTEKHFFLAQLFSTRAQNNSFVAVSIGYGRNFYFDGFNKNSSDPETSAFVLKPSLSISYSQNGHEGDINKPTSLGQLDNTGKSLNILGNVADSNFDVTNTDYDADNNPTTTITNYNSGTLLINLIHQEWALVPKIAIASNQNKHPFHWEIDLGYRISVDDEDGIGLYQTSSDNNDGNEINPFINLYNKNTVVTYNNKIITKSPYNFSGLFFGFTVGWTISKKFPLKKHKF